MTWIEIRRMWIDVVTSFKLPTCLSDSVVGNSSEDSVNFSVGKIVLSKSPFQSNLKYYGQC